MLCGLLAHKTNEVINFRKKGDETNMKITISLDDLSDEALKELAQRTDTPAELLKILANENEWTIRKAVSYNEKTPSELLSFLAQDKNWWVRYAIAINGNTPSKALKTLANDEEEGVRKAANEALNERKTNTKVNKER